MLRRKVGSDPRRSASVLKRLVFTSRGLETGFGGREPGPALERSGLSMDADRRGVAPGRSDGRL